MTKKSVRFFSRLKIWVLAESLGGVEAWPLTVAVVDLRKWLLVPETCWYMFLETFVSLKVKDQWKGFCGPHCIDVVLLQGRYDSTLFFHQIIYSRNSPGTLFGWVESSAPSFWTLRRAWSITAPRCRMALWPRHRLLNGQHYRCGTYLLVDLSSY